MKASVGDGVGQDGPAGAEGRDDQTGHAPGRRSGPRGTSPSSGRWRWAGAPARPPRRRTTAVPGCRRRCRGRRGRRSGRRARWRRRPVMARMPSAAAHSASQRLGELQDQALVEPVGDQAAVGRQQQHRQELQAGGDAHGEPRAAGQLEHEPVLRDPLHPGADVGDEGPAGRSGSCGCRVRRTCRRGAGVRGHAARSGSVGRAGRCRRSRVVHLVQDRARPGAGRRVRRARARRAGPPASRRGADGWPAGPRGRPR